MPPLPIGRINVTVTSITLAGQPGKESLAITVADQAGNSGTWWGHFSDAAMNITTKTLRNLGWDPIARGWEIREITETHILIGRRAVAIVDDENFNGKPRRKIQWLNAPSADASQLSALGSRLRAKFGGTPPAGSPFLPSPGPASAPQVDDEIPF